MSKSPASEAVKQLLHNINDENAKLKQALLAIMNDRNARAEVERQVGGWVFDLVEEKQK